MTLVRARTHTRRDVHGPAGQDEQQSQNLMSSFFVLPRHARAPVGANAALPYDPSSLQAAVRSSRLGQGREEEVVHQAVYQDWTEFPTAELFAPTILATFAPFLCRVARAPHLALQAGLPEELLLPLSQVIGLVYVGQDASEDSDGV